MKVDEWKTNDDDEILGLKYNGVWYHVGGADYSKKAEISKGFELLEKNKVLITSAKKEPLLDLAKLLSYNERKLVLMLSEDKWTEIVDILPKLKFDDGRQMAGVLANLTKKSKQIGYPRSIIEDGVDKTSFEYTYKLRSGCGRILTFLEKEP